jgi:hypothetical protein
MLSAPDASRRPRIKGAIREYQTQLIERVKADIKELHEKFKVQYEHTLNSHMSEVRDLPPVSGEWPHAPRRPTQRCCSRWLSLAVHQTTLSGCAADHLHASPISHDRTPAHFLVGTFLRCCCKRVGSS